MKYNQPYGISNPDAAYINGNPSTGTMGSIPPAASIEHPQREIVNLITDAAMTPSEFDLHQLARGVQGGHLNYAVDNGTANQYSVNVNPPLQAYAAGQRWVFRILNTNTGPSTININGLGARHIVFPQGGELIGGELFAGGLASLVDDGVNLQLATGGGATTTVTASILNAPRHYYVNGTTGDDTLRDGLSATVGVGKTGPFKTLQRAQNAMNLFNLNGFDVYIHVADGTYGPVTCGNINGSGVVHYIGNVSNPAAVLVTNNAGSCFTITGTIYFIDGFKLTATAGPASLTSGIQVYTGGVAYIFAVDFGFCQDAHMVANAASYIGYAGPITISGSATYHMTSQNGSYIQHYNQSIAPNVSIIAAVSFAQFVLALNCGITNVRMSIAGFGNVSGQKYFAYGNGVVYTAGAGGGYYPGSTAGGLTTGGQYI